MFLVALFCKVITKTSKQEAKQYTENPTGKLTNVN